MEMSRKDDSLAMLGALPIPSQAALVMALESIGWQLLSVELDLVAETARIELRQGSLYVMFDARNGRASITREMLDSELVRVGRKGDIAVVERIRPRFLGRQNGLGLRSGLRFLSDYVADNAPVAITHEATRNIFRQLLTPTPAIASIGASA